MPDERTTAELKALVDQLTERGNLDDDGILALMLSEDPDANDYLAAKAREVREKYYGKDVYIRGLIEFTNYCRNNCYYCGIRRDNKNIERYRLSEEQILSCTDSGYELGFRTFVLQGGEDPYYNDDRMVSIVKSIKEKHPDCAITLSIGERSFDSYERLYKAGADRYLLRHETADKAHYESLHPEEMSYDNRIRCLLDLRRIGYQIGCGMMVGSPGQKPEHLLKDLRFIQMFTPEMVGIGPFVPHHDTRYANCEPGTAELTVRLLSLIRLLNPMVLLPATTALGTVDAFGREKGLAAGANVVMPNLSPTDVRDKYLLYDNKICTGDEAAECVRCLSLRVSKAGYQIVTSRGDHFTRQNTNQ